MTSTTTCVDSEREVVARFASGFLFPFFRKENCKRHCQKHLKGFVFLLFRGNDRSVCMLDVCLASSLFRGFVTTGEGAKGKCSLIWKDGQSLFVADDVLMDVDGLAKAACVFCSLLGAYASRHSKGSTNVLEA